MNDEAIVEDGGIQVDDENLVSNDDRQHYRARRKEKNPDRKRFGARNQHKMKDFAKWILQRFGDSLKHENGNSAKILDVAGGKGELAARLCMCHGMHVTLVDPREANIVDVYTSRVLPKLPSKWQLRIQQKVEDNPSFIEDTVHERFEQLVMYFDENTTNSKDFKQSSNRQDDKNETNMIGLREAIRGCDLMIGMHADSATECIVDVALEQKKPFVVVPCCVFPNLFQQRFVMMPSEDPEKPFTKVQVRSHEEFCEYILQKDHRFQKEILPFDGRNVAIWWDGK